ncbi:MAG: ATP-binding cassette domain-containing protein [Lachnospiraceae bacterium]|nr:ATP-binding cassette domain-containing protein [Lachnospiraceae bacterium]
MRIWTKEFLQKNNGDCGIAVLHILADYFGIEDTSVLEEVSTDRLNGIDAGEMKSLSEKLGIELHGYKRNAREMQKIKPPLIALFNLNHYVVWEGITDDGRMSINDPSKGHIELEFSEFENQYSGIVLCAGPGGRSVTENEKTKNEVVKTGAAVAEEDIRLLRQEMEENNRIFSMRNVDFAFGKNRLFEKLSFDLERGEILTVAGSMAAGKTTLLKLVSGELTPDSGTIAKCGEKIKISRISERIITEKKTVFETVCGNNETFDGQKLASALYDAGVYDKIMALPEGINTELQPGLLTPEEEKLLMVAAAFYRETDLLLIDEIPEEMSAREIKRLLLSIRLRGLSCMITSTKKNAAVISSRLLIFSEGKLVKEIVKGREFYGSYHMSLSARDVLRTKPGRNAWMIESGRVMVFDSDSSEAEYVGHAGDIIPDGKILRPTGKTEIRKVQEGNTEGLDRQFRKLCESWQRRRQTAFGEMAQNLIPLKSTGIFGEETETKDNIAKTENIKWAIENGELFLGTILENIAVGENASEEEIIELMKDNRLGALLARLPMGIYSLLDEKGEGISEGERIQIIKCRKKFKEQREVRG